MSKTVAFVKCGCKHDYQDKKYGSQVRVANATAKGDQQSIEVRCTVCTTTHRVSTSSLK